VLHTLSIISLRGPAQHKTQRASCVGLYSRLGRQNQDDDARQNLDRQRQALADEQIQIADGRTTVEKARSPSSTIHRWVRFGMIVSG